MKKLEHLKEKKTKQKTTNNKEHDCVFLLITS